MSKSTWTGATNSDWADPDNWSPVGVPGVNSDVTIASGRAIASASIGTVNSITDSSDLRFRSAGTNTVATFLDNSGELRVDRKGGAGGTILNIAGKLTNSGSLRIGNATLSAPDEVTAAALDNTRGEIFLLGSTTDQALLDVNSSAGFGTGGILSGYARLVGDSAIEFKSGQITSVATGADLTLNGNDAFIEDSTALGSNSALAGLSNVAGTLDLENGAKVSTTGALAIATYGFVDLDVLRRDGGSSLTLTGALTNSGTLLIGNASLSAPDQVTAASLDNTGVIVLRGSSANQALLDVTGSAGFGTAAVLSGNVSLSGDSAIEFKSGQITTIAASSSLELDGNDAFIEDSTALGSNSALTGLTSIGAGALLDLNNGASASTTGALVNYGNVELDYPGSVGGSSLTVGGTLTNNGSISITYDTEELAGAVGGAGGFSLQQGNLQFDSSVSSGQTITETNAALILEQAQKFGGTISNFGTGDTIDAANFLLSGTTFNFHENTAGTGGTLTLTDGSLTANISMTGVYTKSDFTLAPDSGTGTLVKFV